MRDDLELRRVHHGPAVCGGSMPKRLLYAQDLPRPRIQVRANLRWLWCDPELRDVYRSENLWRRRSTGPVRMHAENLRPARVPVRSTSRRLRRSPQLRNVWDRQSLRRRQVRADGLKTRQLTLVLASFFASSRALAASSS